MLMALANADRASDLCALDVRYLSLTAESANFQVTALTKSSRPDREIVSFYARLEDEMLCPLHTLQLYLRLSAPWRDNPDKNRLLLSINKPHHTVTPATVGHWLKEALRAAGVSENFTAHSTRATAVSVAFDKGISITDILKTADWTSDSVFKKHYYKPAESHVIHRLYSCCSIKHMNISCSSIL